MRAAWLLAVAVGCGGAPPPPPAATDDLELDHQLARRERAVATAPEAPAPEPATPAVRVEVVEEAAPAAGGPRIDLAVRDADVTDVLRMIAAAARIGLVVADDVRARVTLDIRGVTWRQAIDVIAHLEGLAVREADGIVTVTKAP